MGSPGPYCPRVFTTMAGIDSDYNVAIFSRRRRFLHFDCLLLFFIIDIHHQPVAVVFIRRQQEALCPGPLLQIQDHPEEIAMLTAPDVLHVSVAQRRLRQRGKRFGILQVDNDPVRLG